MKIEITPHGRQTRVPPAPRTRGEPSKTATVDVTRRK